MVERKECERLGLSKKRKNGENHDTVEEEIADLMAGGAVDDLEEDEVCVRTNLEQYIGYEFSSQTTTNSWMKWDTKGSH